MKQTERQTEQRDTMIKNTQGNQFDQMAELSFRFWAINSNENLPNIIKICPIRLKILPNVK